MSWNVMFCHVPLHPSSSPRPPSRGPASVLAAAPDRGPGQASAVRSTLCWPRRYRESWMDPGSGAGVTVEGRDGRPSCLPSGRLAADSPALSLVRERRFRISVRIPHGRSSIAFRSSPFRSSRRRLARCGGTLFRAYRARLSARVAAGAVRAPDCPCARGRAQDARLPSASRGFLNSRRREPGEEAVPRGHRFPMPPSSTMFPIVKPKLRIISFFSNEPRLSAGSGYRRRARARGMARAPRVFARNCKRAAPDAGPVPRPVLNPGANPLPCPVRFDIPRGYPSMRVSK